MEPLCLIDKCVKHTTQSLWVKCKLGKLCFDSEGPRADKMGTLGLTGNWYPVGSVARSYSQTQTLVQLSNPKLGGTFPGRNDYGIDLDDAAEFTQ